MVEGKKGKRGLEGGRVGEPGQEKTVTWEGLGWGKKKAT